MSSKKQIEKYKQAVLDGKKPPKFSRPMAVKLHCLECCSCDIKSAKECPCKLCLLYSINPWVKLKNKEDAHEEPVQTV